MNVKLINHVTGQYLDYKNCTRRKKLIHKLVEVCSEDIDGNNMIHNVILNYYGRVYNSFTIYIVLLVIVFLTMCIGGVFFYFFWYSKKDNTETFIYYYIKMLYYGKINILKEIDINKSSKLKECMICHY